MPRTRPTRPARRRTAIVAAFLLGLVTLLGTVDAGAAGAPTTTLTVVDANATAGLTLSVSGSDYTGLPNSSTGAPAQGIYVALRDPATMTDAAINADNSLPPALTYLPPALIAGGNWTTTLHADAADLDSGATYEVIVWVAHGVITPTTLVDTVGVTLSASQREALFPGSTPTTTTSTSTTVPGTTVPTRRTTVVVKDANATDGLILSITGTGYTGLPRASTGAPAQGIYVALRDPATMTDAAINADNSIVPAVAMIPSAAIAGGNWSATLDAAAADLEPDATYEVIVWVAHGVITPTTLVDTVGVTLSAEQRTALFGGGNPPSSTTPPPTTRPATTVRPTTPPTTTRTQATTPGGGYCVTESTSATIGTPQLDWGVKSSFVSYIESAVAKGTVTTAGGVTRTANAFIWHNGSGTVSDAGSGTWTFPGSVTFTGHGGALNTTLANLRVQATGADRGVLIADVNSTDIEGNDVGGAGMTIADLSFSSVSSTGANASVTLTAQGARALNNMYDAGDPMDPLTVSVTDGASGSTVQNCYDAAGNLISSTPIGGGGHLPATGSDTAGLLAAGAMLTVLGMLAVALAARTRRTGTRQI